MRTRRVSDCADLRAKDEPRTSKLRASCCIATSAAAYRKTATVGLVSPGRADILKHVGMLVHEQGSGVIEATICSSEIIPSDASLCRDIRVRS